MKRVRCPSCLTEVPTGGGKVASRCPGCGAKIAADPTPAKPTRPRKVRKKARKVHHFDWIGPLMSASAALALFVVSLGVAGVVGLLTSTSEAGPYASSPGPDPAAPPITFPQPRPTTPTTSPTKPETSTPAPTWLAKNDPPPASAKPFEFTSARGIPVYGNPIVAAFGGPFAIDTPERGWNLDPALMAKEDAMIPVVDLRTGKPAGKVPKQVQRSSQAVLSEDGKLLAARQPQLLAGETLVEVWSTDIDQPPWHLPEKRSVDWMGFAGSNELVVYAGGEAQQVQIWDAATGARLRDVDLPADLFPPQKGVTGFQVERLRAEISPGRTYLALGAPAGIAVIDLREAKLAGRIKHESSNGKPVYQGFTFSADGSLLAALVTWQKQSAQNKTQLLSWRMKDGDLERTIDMPAQAWIGPPFTGTRADQVLVPLFESNRDSFVWKCHSFEKGQPGQGLPWKPLCRLADGRLLVVGPIKDAPPETPLPAVLTDPKRDDPAVRGIYPVSVD